MALLVATFAGIVKANGTPVIPNPPANPAIIQWLTGGLANYGTLMTDPEFLAAYAKTTVYTETTIIIEGKDVFGKSIEASATIPPGASSQTPFIFYDTHSESGPTPVAFAQITKVLQQGGTDNEVFAIYTHPEAVIPPLKLGALPLEEYMGMYESTNGIYLPGVYDNNPTPYQVTVGVGIAYGTQSFPFEPRNPDPIKVVVEWADGKSPTPIEDRYPQANEVSGQTGGDTVSLTIQGLDQTGSPITQTINIAPGTPKVDVPGIWSTVCKISGGSGSYYIFTEPKNERPLFTYTLLIDHISINPKSYDILAYPNEVANSAPWFPGKTDVIVALRDIDDNPIFAADYGKIGSTNIPNLIVVNFFTSGGTIKPSTDVTIAQGSAYTYSCLTADTNPRTINVTAVVYVPACIGGAHGSFTLFAWTEMTEDGVNSANDYVWGTWPIHTMQWGYTDSIGVRHTFDVPPKPWLPSELGGPERDAIKLDGPIYEVAIPLWTGCNLVSSPVSPLLQGCYYTNYPTSVIETGVPTPSYPTINNQGIPMDLLFGKTAAVDTIEAIWWYDGTWHVYIPGVSKDPNAYFRDGVGYWIKADQPCTLEISGVYLENGPFTPPTYTLTGNSWSLVGVTSITGIQTSQYLESTMGSQAIEAAGPVWQYIAPSTAYPSWFQQGWIRDPATVWPGQAFWVYNKVPTSINIAP
jgi:hypothetical protein